jgi:hypothetical protein
MEIKMRFLTNVHKNQLDDVMHELMVGWNGRLLTTGVPQHTPAATAEYLKSVGVIGLYEVAPGVAVS